jgi:hypothetical protein
LAGRYFILKSEKMEPLNKVEVLDKANYFALIEGKQIMFFTTRQQGRYLILWCKAEGTKPQYKLSDEGVKYSERRYFNDVSSYIGKIIYLKFLYNDLNLWQELYDEKLFSLWDPKEGPFEYNRNNVKRIAICQVFKTNVVIKKEDIGGGRTSRILYNYGKMGNIEKGLKNMTPILPKQEFIDRVGRIVEIINKYQ